MPLLPFSDVRGSPTQPPRSAPPPRSHRWERRLWYHLQRRQLHGAKFRRQHPIGPFIADLCCVEAWLIVEVDGGQHSAEADAGRTAYMERLGFTVLRLWNLDVLSNTEGALRLIGEALDHRLGPGQP